MPSPSFAFLLTLITLSILFWLVTFKRTTGFTEPDLWVADALFPPIRSFLEESLPPLHGLLLGISAMGSGWFVALGFAALGSLLLALGRTDLAWLAALGTIAFPIEWALKYFTADPAISVAQLGAALFNVSEIGLDDLADFPAGHALRSTVFYGIAAFAFARLTVDHRRGLIAYAAALILVVAISLIRIYLGAHFPIDVIGGWFAGLALLTIVVAVHVMRADERVRSRAGSEPVAVPSRRRAYTPRATRRAAAPPLRAERQPPRNEA